MEIAVMRIICLVIAAMLAQPAQAANKTIPAGDLAKLMAETKVVAVTELPVPASEYKSDGDPETLEIVFLKSAGDGSSRVSDDGEVIFHRDDENDDDVQKLIVDAFGIRAVRRGLAK
jgi:hypothetical protein